MNDRSLRTTIVGLGGPLQGVPRETGFDITAASEIMAILCLSENEEDLRKRLDRILVGFTYDKAPVEASKLKVTGAMLALLSDALKPNLVQTLEGVPALIHGGPFANIAHGCNSVLATRTALHLADWAVTEAGFGCDLGAEKFFDIKCRTAGFDPRRWCWWRRCARSRCTAGGRRKISPSPTPPRSRPGSRTWKSTWRACGRSASPRSSP